MEGTHLLGLLHVQTLALTGIHIPASHAFPETTSPYPVRSILIAVLLNYFNLNQKCYHLVRVGCLFSFSCHCYQLYLSLILFQVLFIEKVMKNSS